MIRTEQAYTYMYHTLHLSRVEIITELPHYHDKHFFAIKRNYTHSTWVNQPFDIHERSVTNIQKNITPMNMIKKSSFMNVV